MSLGRLRRWIKKPNPQDFSNSKPFLTNYFIAYGSFRDEDKAVLTDVVARNVYMIIDRCQHEALVLADGKRTIREISVLVHKKYPERHDSVLSAEKDTLKLFQMLHGKGIVELMING